MDYFGNNTYSSITNNTTGEDFEDTMFFSLCKYSKKVKRHHGDALDKNQGTDITFMDMRIDATADFNNKDYMPYVMDTGIKAYHGETFKIGIRHGNSHKGYTEFSQPVVVIGINCPNGVTYHTFEDDIVKNLGRNISDIVDMAVCTYEDYTTRNMEDRKDLDDQPLRKNPSYQSPRNLGKRYQELNELQESIMPLKTGTSYENSL